MTTDIKPLRIDIWSDMVCPWCWIGKHRLATALKAHGLADADIHWHPFLLDPEADATPVPLREAYAQKFGSAERVEQILGQTQSTAQAEGLPMDFDQGQVRVTTLEAHRLMLLATELGVADAVGEALFRAHFAEGRNLAERDVLLAAAVAGGLDRQAADDFLASDIGRDVLDAEMAQAQKLGIRAVPTFVFDGQLAVQGAQTPEVFAQVFEKLGVAGASAAEGDAAMACGPDGCAV